MVDPGVVITDAPAGVAGDGRVANVGTLFGIINSDVTFGVNVLLPVLITTTP